MTPIETTSSLIPFVHASNKDKTVIPPRHAAWPLPPKDMPEVPASSLLKTSAALTGTIHQKTPITNTPPLMGRTHLPPPKSLLELSKSVELSSRKRLPRSQRKFKSEHKSNSRLAPPVPKLGSTKFDTYIDNIIIHLFSTMGSIEKIPQKTNQAIYDLKKTCRRAATFQLNLTLTQCLGGGCASSRSTKHLTDKYDELISELERLAYIFKKEVGCCFFFSKDNCSSKLKRFHQLLDLMKRTNHDVSLCIDDYSQDPESTLEWICKQVTVFQERTSPDPERQLLKEHPDAYMIFEMEM